MKAYQDLPIISLSANVMASDVDMAIESGMNAHIGKPINQAVLLSTIIDNL